jgi:1-acyl-sn-glycerol-3-phosphate acyltransferase
MKTLLVRLRSILIWIVALPVFAAACFAVWLGSFVLPGRFLEPLIKAACRVILFVCGIRVRVHGRENVLPGRRYVVMMNHVNFFDPFVLYAAFPGWSRGIEEESHFRWPVYGPTIRRLGVIPISRTDSARAKVSMSLAADTLRARPRYSLAILPEGGRTPDGRLGTFKRGGFLLALETGLEVLPMIQVGAREINRKGSRLIRPGRVDVFIEAAVPPTEYTKDGIWDYVDRVRGIYLDRLP